MGVYHLMGLGLSPGAITGPLTYLANRYRRWNVSDQHFFARSGEAAQRKVGDKVGDVQGIALFTTREVLAGYDEASGRTFTSFHYTDNPAGRIAGGPLVEGEPMKQVLRKLFRREWPGIGGGRRKVTIFWCEVNRRDIGSTYERVARVVTALSGAGGQGKEMWVNLTGGNNVINFALELAATMSGDVARLYYVQAENPDAEKCVRYTAEEGYWVELPVMPLALGRLSRAILDLLRVRGPLTLSSLYSTLQSEYWDLSRGLVSGEVLREEYLAPLWKQGLVAEVSRGYVVGAQWALIQPYEQILARARAACATIEKLAEQEPWIEAEELKLV
ncbi:MAG: hypothetical protein JXA14_18535 [Anaerolineae bacterium]|nr:hypothetical protein [Anaerolineae bacterium]